jgi:hypothetical protein
MSAFPESGHSISRESGILTGRFRPQPAVDFAFSTPTGDQLRDRCFLGEVRRL